MCNQLYIGLPLEKVISELGDIPYEIIYNDSDKQKNWDTQLVVNIKQADKLKIYVSKFLLRVQCNE